MRLKAFAVACGMMFAAFVPSADAAQTHVAVAANFTEPAKEIAALFRQKTGHEAILIFGASGGFYAQITQGAPFEVFLSADEERPRLAVENGYAVPESRFTYAIGKLVLWSKVVDVTDGEAVLKAGNFSKVSIANPASAPYGSAAIETMKALGVFDALQPKIVQGSSIAQAFQFVDTRNAEVGFVALAQLYGNAEGTRWLVPEKLHPSIRQDALLLKNGANDEASKAFLVFLRGPEARGVIERFGYGLDIVASRESAPAH
jgi:molybdate transport system substrate-binding protein